MNKHLTFVIMRAKKVLKILNICRATLEQYVKKGTIRVVRQPNGMYEYDDDVYRKAGLADNIKAVVYERVLTVNQKKDLEIQAEIEVLLHKDLVHDHKISAIYIPYKNRFYHISFNL